MFYGRKSDLYLFWPVEGKSNVLPKTGETACPDEAVLLKDGCLRSGVIWPEPRFVIKPDRVIDRLTYLTWHLGLDSQTPLSGSEALAAVQSLAEKTKESWRMPTINEFESLVDASMHDPALPSDHPFQSLHDGYWSSATSGYSPDWSYVLYLNNGAVGVGFKRTTKIFTFGQSWLSICSD